ncbi:type II secretion system protein M [Wenzhouxiangella sp. AB-CW3]|uniref:type II secretion system protein GspM n=1 Tax=Wenzhouxiangella sp. AB-CW3 TaxID=2771012 RepID=UPI00168B7C70|nr:type II secretion system protein GspM [Wenzhouxiangella sp. AB-CW3]QOC23839.1 type II secretion system protein M [Wenzhouxiangella sp. AB-CW3]
MTLKVRLKQLAERINALSLRERALLMLTALAVVFLLWDTFLMRPVSERHERAQEQLSTIRERVDSLTDSIQELAGERRRDPDAELRQRHEQLTTEIEALESRLSRMHGGVATARQSVTVLASLLGERAGVDIVTLENLPAEPLRAGDNELSGIYVHRVRLVIESDFDGVRDYLAMVDTLPAGVFWDSMRLTVDEWPTNHTEIILYSLALDEEWLGI